jgi:parallel beta-helix repeat protein
LTVLEGRNLPSPHNVCLTLRLSAADVEQNGLNGICVANVDANGNMLTTVHNVRVTGFTVDGFPGVGIVFAFVSGIRADHDVASNNSAYGITAFSAANGLFDDNLSFGSGDAGFYVGDSPDANFTVRDNIAHDDLWGVLARDSSMGLITNNVLHDNCSGLVFLYTGAGGPDQQWVATHNSASHNDNYCAASYTGLPFTLTGIGVLIAGGDQIVLHGNTVTANRPSGTPTTIDGVALAGGVVVVSTASVQVFPGINGGDAANNTVASNTVEGNQPFDLAYDGQGTGNRFTGNTCHTSTPPGQCTN